MGAIAAMHARGAGPCSKCGRRCFYSQLSFLKVSHDECISMHFILLVRYQLIYLLGSCRTQCVQYIRSTQYFCRSTVSTVSVVRYTPGTHPYHIVYVHTCTAIVSYIHMADVCVVGYTAIHNIVPQLATIYYDCMHICTTQRLRVRTVHWQLV